MHTCGYIRAYIETSIQLANCQPPPPLPLQTEDDPAMAGPQTAIFSPVFNALGLVPLVFASLLCGGGAFGKGRQPVPPQPFVFGTALLGFFAVGPYLALRNYLPEMDAEEEPTLLEVRAGRFNVILFKAPKCFAGNRSIGYVERAWKGAGGNIFSVAIA